jgi:hypothetical protein
MEKLQRKKSFILSTVADSAGSSDRKMPLEFLPEFLMQRLQSNGQAINSRFKSLRISKLGRWLLKDPD